MFSLAVLGRLPDHPFPAFWKGLAAPAEVPDLKAMIQKELWEEPSEGSAWTKQSGSLPQTTCGAAVRFARLFIGWV